MRHRFVCVVCALAALVPAAALAHPGHGAGEGVLHELAHLLSRLDILAAIVAMALCGAWEIRRRRRMARSRADG